MLERGLTTQTLKKRAEDVLAYFERPGTSNGPIEVNYRLRILLAAGGHKPWRTAAHPAS